MNQFLKNKKYKLPQEVLNYVQKALMMYSNNNMGVRRAKFIVKNGLLTYQELKRLKNFFDTFNPEINDKKEYVLAGGNLMKSFIEKTLNADRSAVERSKKVRRDMTANPNSELMPYQTPRLNENKKKDELKKNAVAIIVNEDNKILLLKRADDSKIWMPNKWALVGGGIEKNETPEEACKREVKEEIGLEIDKFINSFTIKRHSDSIEHIFTSRYNGDPTDIKLNNENTNYGWFGVEEMEYLDTVPHLVEYIVLTFKKYE